MAFHQDQITDLDAPLDGSRVKKRTQGNVSLSYIEGWWAIKEANRIFGYDGWDRETVSLECVWSGERKTRSGDKPAASYIAKVRVTVRDKDGAVVATREGTGAGSGFGNDVGEAHESAAKEAETDAMKRALMTFGNPFGLALYDKTQEDVVTGSGPLTKTKLVEQIREIRSELEACSDVDEYDTCLGTYKAVVDQFSKDMPGLWFGPVDAGKPWKDIFDAIREKLAGPDIGKKAKTIDFVWPDGKVSECATPSEYFKTFKTAIMNNRACWEMDENREVLERFIAANPTKYQPEVDALEEMAAGDPAHTMAG